jgi:flavin reductase (DIM6/NTAB) family NADH-FMN oxidoreductase RutF
MSDDGSSVRGRSASDHHGKWVSAVTTSDRYATARQALSTIPLAVVLVGAGADRERGCATGTAMYVSFSPPRIAIALHPGSHTTDLVRQTGFFSLSVLGADQVDVAMRAGRGARGTDKFAELELAAVNGPNGTPALADALANVWCSVVDTQDVGDHVLVIGEVTAWDRRALDVPDAPPALVRHIRRYAARGSWASDAAPEGYPT